MPAASPLSAALPPALSPLPASPALSLVSLSPAPARPRAHGLSHESSRTRPARWLGLSLVSPAAPQGARGKSLRSLRAVARVCAQPVAPPRGARRRRRQDTQARPRPRVERAAQPAGGARSNAARGSRRGPVRGARTPPTPPRPYPRRPHARRPPPQNTHAPGSCVDGGLGAASEENARTQLRDACSRPCDSDHSGNRPHGLIMETYMPSSKQSQKGQQTAAVLQALYVRRAAIERAISALENLRKFPAIPLQRAA